MANFIKMKIEAAKAEKAKNDVGNTHINMQFKENDMRQEAPEVITEKQLKKDSKPEETATMEKLLESVRTNIGADALTERRLDNEKSPMGSKYRDPKAYEGDINKLEEKRIQAGKVEDEKYKPSSEISKKMRWWENLKPAKADKSANSIYTLKTAQGLDFSDESRFKRFKGNDENDFVENDVGAIGEERDVDETEEDDNENDDILGSPEGTVKEPTVDTSKLYLKKNVKNVSEETGINSLFIDFSYNNADFISDTDAIASAMAKVLEMYPFLHGQIETTDFMVKKQGKLPHSDVLLRLVDFDDSKQPEYESPFAEITLSNKDIGGTDHIVGSVKLSPTLVLDFSDKMFTEGLMKDAVDYIGEEKGIDIPVDALRIDKRNKVINFMYAPPKEVAPEAVAGEGLEGIGEEGDDEIDEIEEMLAEDKANTQETDVPLSPETTRTPMPVTSKSNYDFPIVIAEAKTEDLKKKIS